MRSIESVGGRISPELHQSSARAPRARDPQDARYPTVDHALLRRVSRDSRVRAHLDHLRQRLCAARDGGLSPAAREAQLQDAGRALSRLSDDLRRGADARWRWARPSRCGSSNRDPRAAPSSRATVARAVSASVARSPSTWAAPPRRSASSTITSREISRSFEFGRMYRFLKGQRAADPHSGDRDGRDRRGRRLDRARRRAASACRSAPTAPASEPGPACYARGGEHATVTDADCAMGYSIRSASPAAAWRSSRSAPKRAVKRDVAKPLGSRPRSARSPSARS